MELNSINDDIFIDFAMLIDEFGVNKNNACIIKTNNEIKVVVMPSTTPPPQDYFEVQKTFRFFNNHCIYEYGCIRLDFSSDWQNYIDNLNKNLEY